MSRRRSRTSVLLETQPHAHAGVLRNLCCCSGKGCIFPDEQDMFVFRASNVAFGNAVGLLLHAECVLYIFQSYKRFPL